MPNGYDGNVVGLLTDIEQPRVKPDQTAKVIIDEQSGVIVMGENVRSAPSPSRDRLPSGPSKSRNRPFAEVGTTATTDRTNVEVDEGEEHRLTVLKPGVTLQELVNGLNALGIGPRDMITILQAVKASGALQADIEVM